MTKHDSKLLAIGFLALSLCAVVVRAATPGDTSPDATNGSVQCSNTTPTLIPCQPASGQNACFVQNLGPNAIYLGWSTIDGGYTLADGGFVTASTWGVQIAASGGNASIDIVRQNRLNLRQPWLYCQAATAAQTSPNDTRYMGVK